MATVKPTILHLVSAIGPDGVREEVKPYLIEIGLMALAWNSLHENLGELFWRITRISNGGLPFAIWHELRDDRAQRNILRAAASTGLHAWSPMPGQPGERWVKTGKQKIGWLLSEIENLSNSRNNFLHAPFMFHAALGTPEPHDFFGHPRAKALRGKNFLDEIQRDRENMAILGTYSIALRFRLDVKCEPHVPWPSKPHLLAAF
jgi:hypothetical protein